MRKKNKFLKKALKELVKEEKWEEKRIKVYMKKTKIKYGRKMSERDVESIEQFKQEVKSLLDSYKHVYDVGLYTQNRRIIIVSNNEYKEGFNTSKLIDDMTIEMAKLRPIRFIKKGRVAVYKIDEDKDKEDPEIEFKGPIEPSLNIKKLIDSKKKSEENHYEL